MGNKALVQEYHFETRPPVEKTITDFQDEAAAIRKRYRVNWQDSPNFRLPNGSVNFLPPGTTESIVFAQTFLELGVESGGLVNHYIKYHPNVTAGLAGFFAGLMDDSNIAMLEYDWTHNPNTRREAFKNYLRRACVKGALAGLVRGTAWAAVDYVVGSLWDHIQDRVVGVFSLDGSRELAKACGGFCIVPAIKLLIDTLLYSQGKSLQHPCGKQNLTTTGLSIAIATAMGHFIVGPASYVVAFIMGNFINSYIFGFVQESCDRNESFWTTLQTRMVELREWASKPSGVRWVVPDAILETIPSEMICCVSHSLFMEPVILHDMVFEKEDLLRWVREHGCHPLNLNMQVSMSEAMPAPEMQSLCHEFARLHDLIPE